MNCRPCRWLTFIFPGNTAEKRIVLIPDRLVHAHAFPVRVRHAVPHAENRHEIRVYRAAVFVEMNVRFFGLPRISRRGCTQRRCILLPLPSVFVLLRRLRGDRVRGDRVRVLQKLAEEKHVAKVLGVDAELGECWLSLTHLFGNAICTVHVVAAVRVDGADQGVSVFLRVKVEHKIDKAPDLRARHRVKERASARQGPDRIPARQADAEEKVRVENRDVRVDPRELLDPFIDAKLVQPDEAREAEKLVLVPVNARMKVRCSKFVLGVERGHIDDRAEDAVGAVEGAPVDWRFVLAAFLLLLLELGCTISQELPAEC